MKSNENMALTAYIDGASKGNPGPAGIGFSIEKEGVVLEDYDEYIGEATNNIAEYRALIAAMKRIKTLGAKNVMIFSDSELVVRQINGLYKVKNPGLRPLHAEAIKISRLFEYFRINHVPRDRNSRADGLANKAIKKHIKTKHLK